MYSLVLTPPVASLVIVVFLMPLSIRSNFISRLNGGAPAGAPVYVDLVVSNSQLPMSGSFACARACRLPIRSVAPRTTATKVKRNASLEHGVFLPTRARHTLVIPRYTSRPTPHDCEFAPSAVSAERPRRL